MNGERRRTKNMTNLFSTTLITILLLIYPKGLSGEQCEPSDCVEPSMCPAYVDLVRKALYSHNYDSYNISDYSSTTSSPIAAFECDTQPGYICCSKVSDIEYPSKRFYLEDHPNLELLPDDCGPINWNRTLQRVEQNYPWLALIGYNNIFHCEGTLINERYVLTLAQCVKNKNIVNLGSVRLGEVGVRRCGRHSQNVQEEGYCDDIEHQDVPVETVIIHNRYNSTSGDNDIALLRLRNEADFSRPNIAPICLPKIDRILRTDLTQSPYSVWISDWKLDVRDYEPSEDLPLIIGCKVPTKGEIKCTENEFRCKGDPGSPLMVGSYISESQIGYVQYGMLLKAPFPCLKDTPRKYTDVTEYMEFILNSIIP